MEQRLEKWNNWIDQICDDVVKLMRYRYIFKEIMDIGNKNPYLRNHKQNPFVEYIQNTYVAFIANILRRQLKREQHNSFTQLLYEISETPKLLSLELFLENLNQSEHKNAEDIFLTEFAGSQTTFVDPKRVNQDLRELTERGDSFVSIADKCIIHNDIQHPNVEPAFQEVHNCIDLLEHLFRKYWLLFKGETLENDWWIIEDNWKDIFLQPWILPNNESNMDSTDWWNVEGDKEWDEWTP
ncbi:hypothetical protein C6497_11270 [Candidatus Poribacteria bacterium]|nr:MAG: hypothetical protein C6497_11270 [Candidatus Poribacteria bacterium]